MVLNRPIDWLTSSGLGEGIKAVSAAYNKRFDEVFPVPKQYQTTDPEGLRQFSKAITSNLVGGIGYFYGNSIVDRHFAHEWDQDDDDASEEASKEKGPTLAPPKGLLTATPSRSFFPRGFYWSVPIDYTTALTDLVQGRRIPSLTHWPVRQ